MTPDLAQPGYAQPGAAPPAGQHHCSAAYALASLPAQSAKPREPKAAMSTRTPKAPPLSAYLCFAHATRLKLVEEAKAQVITWFGQNK